MHFMVQMVVHVRKEKLMKTGKNMEGYSDPTASVAMATVFRGECEADRRAYDLMKILKYIIRLAGFELINRVQLKDIKTGRTYK